MKLWREPFDRAQKATKPAKVIIDKDRCKGCGYCAEFCPKGVLEMSQEINSKGYPLPVVLDQNRCLACGLCEAICPDFGIFIRYEKEGGL
ncbi:MAG: 4Fe-4S binding protein [Chloroflexota bacterium]|nr:4Fe-4S binding protein [Chloroflexota bacterium]